MHGVAPRRCPRAASTSPPSRGPPSPSGSGRCSSQVWCASVALQRQSDDTLGTHASTGAGVGRQGLPVGLARQATAKGQWLQLAAQGRQPAPFTLASAIAAAWRRSPLLTCARVHARAGSPLEEGMDWGVTTGPASPPQPPNPHAALPPSASPSPSPAAAPASRHARAPARSPSPSPGAASQHSQPSPSGSHDPAAAGSGSSPLLGGSAGRARRPSAGSSGAGAAASAGGAGQPHRGSPNPPSGGGGGGGGGWAWGGPGQGRGVNKSVASWVVLRGKGAGGTGRGGCRKGG